MSFINGEHIEALKLLVKHEVEFILVGGVAVNFYGYSRSTGDIDIWLKPDNLNKEKLLKMLREYGIEEADIETLSHSDFAQVLAFHIGSPPFLIDFLTHIAGVRWEDAWPNRVEADMDGLKLNFIHLNQLKANKLASGRPKDLEDIRRLSNNELL